MTTLRFGLLGFRRESWVRCWWRSLHPKCTWAKMFNQFQARKAVLDTVLQKVLPCFFYNLLFMSFLLLPSFTHVLSLTTAFLFQRAPWLCQGWTVAGHLHCDHERCAQSENCRGPWHRGDTLHSWWTQFGRWKFAQNITKLCYSHRLVVVITCYKSS